MKPIPLITISAFGALAIMLWNQSSQLSAIRAELALVKEMLNGDRVLEAGDTSAPSALKRHSELAERMSKVPADDAEAYAKAVSEVDEWLFHPDDEEKVVKDLEKHVAILRDKLTAEIQKQLESAILAATGKEASAFISKAGVLFGLLPQPSTEEEKKLVESLSVQVSAAARRVDEIRRLRYNQWVSTQVQWAFTGLHDKKKSFGNDDDDLIQSFVTNLGEVETSHLDPAVSGIYQQILTLTTDALAEPNKLELAKKLSAPSTIRKSPLDF
ncbi:MAG: hypothetical protein V4662_18940 [Verrucomicrobiota bacterium]